MSHNAFACIASLFQAGLDCRVRCSDDGEQDKSYEGKRGETLGRLGRERGNSATFASQHGGFVPREWQAAKGYSDGNALANNA